MSGSLKTSVYPIILFLAVGIFVAPSVLGQMKHSEHGMKKGAGHPKPAGQSHSQMMKRKPEAPIRITMDEMHRLGGVPKGWKFRIPDGDPDDGRKVFVEMQCHQCHAVQGERFSHVDRGPKDVGPDLSGMGSHHPPEYFAESVVNPNRVITIAEGYLAKDGSSIMPSYADVLTVQDLVDLVAYISSLKMGGSHAEQGHGPAHGEKKEMGREGHKMGEKKAPPRHGGHMKDK